MHDPRGWVHGFDQDLTGDRVDLPVLVDGFQALSELPKAQPGQVSALEVLGGHCVASQPLCVRGHHPDRGTVGEDCQRPVGNDEREGESKAGAEVPPAKTNLERLAHRYVLGRPGRIECEAWRIVQEHGGRDRHHRTANLESLHPLSQQPGRLMLCHHRDATPVFRFRDFAGMAQGRRLRAKLGMHGHMRSSRKRELEGSHVAWRCDLLWLPQMPVTGIANHLW